MSEDIGIYLKEINETLKEIVKGIEALNMNITAISRGKSD